MSRTNSAASAGSAVKNKHRDVLEAVIELNALREYGSRKLHIRSFDTPRRLGK
jgi:hypothetical protein